MKNSDFPVGCIVTLKWPGRVAYLYDNHFMVVGNMKDGDVAIVLGNEPDLPLPTPVRFISVLFG